MGERGIEPRSNNGCIRANETLYNDTESVVVSGTIITGLDIRMVSTSIGAWRSIVSGTNTFFVLHLVLYTVFVEPTQHISRRIVLTTVSRTIVIPTSFL